MADIEITAEMLKSVGYAEGSYLCFCTKCRKKFVGDKRSIVCSECAIDLIMEKMLHILDERKEPKLAADLLEEMEESKVLLYDSIRGMNKFIRATQNYVKVKIAWTKCKQDSFRQLCHRCEVYATCTLYKRYCDCWITLQEFILEKKDSEA